MGGAQKKSLGLRMSWWVRGYSLDSMTQHVVHMFYNVPQYVQRTNQSCINLSGISLFLTSRWSVVWQSAQPPSPTGHRRVVMGYVLQLFPPASVRGELFSC